MGSDRVQQAASGAFKSMNKVMGNPDNDIRLYESLNKEDFAFIANEYGADATAEYIQTMETTRMKEGR